MDSTPKLGIHDLVPVRPGRNADDAMRDTLRLADLADTTGYRRYWLTEHCGSLLLDCPNAQLLVGQLAARPSATAAPEVWLLGADTESARIAGTLGLPFSFAHFIAPDGGTEVIGAYSQMVTASAHRSRPRASLIVSVVCHGRASVARRLLLCAARAWRAPALSEPGRGRPRAGHG